MFSSYFGRKYASVGLPRLHSEHLCVNCRAELGSEEQPRGFNIDVNPGFQSQRQADARRRNLVQLRSLDRFDVCILKN